MNYYNTTNLKGQNLKNQKKKAETQNKKILNLFIKHKKLSCSEVYKLYDCINTPLTSIRRGVTVLYNNGKVVKTINKNNGLYGRKEYIYKLNE
jgi:hypothetical protein